MWLAVVLGAWAGLGLRRSAGDEWQVERATAAVRAPDPGSRAVLHGPLAVGRREMERDPLEAEIEWSDEDDATSVSLDIDPMGGSVVHFRARPVLATGESPGAVLAAVVWGDARVWRLTSLHEVPDGSGIVTISRHFDHALGQPVEVVLATHWSGLKACRDRRIFFGDQAAQFGHVGRAQIAPSSLSRAKPSVDLGTVTLARPRHLGSLCFVSTREDPSDVALLMSGPEPPASSRQRASRTWTRRTVAAGDLDLHFSTFFEPASWDVIIGAPEGCRLFRHTALPGDVVDVVFARSTGVVGTVNLARHPRAARVVILAGATAQVATPLGLTDYKAHEADAVRIMALPMPDRRGRMRAYPLGHVGLDDGSYRVELWSLRDVDGMRDRLAFRTFQVAGDRTELTL